MTVNGRSTFEKTRSASAVVTGSVASSCIRMLMFGYMTLWSRAANAELGRCYTGCCSHLRRHMSYSDFTAMTGPENKLMYLLNALYNSFQSPSGLSKCINDGTARHKLASNCCLFFLSINFKYFTEISSHFSMF